MLLKTRFYLPPLRQHCVPRPQLVERLQHSSGGELVLISAPAGYGKTTLVSQWLHAHPHAFSWITLDKSMSVPVVFWRYFINALRNAQPQLGESALTLLEGTEEGSLQAALVALLNDLDALSVHNRGAPLTLVLDDIHELDNSVLMKQLSLFLDHLPPALRIVATARSEPPLALARRRANNQLLQLGADDLLFAEEESRTFFRQTMDLALEDNLIAKLSHSAEGWAAGLQLIALSLQRERGVPAAQALESIPLHRDVADYLFDEVFDRQPPSLKAFLVLTACVPRFCAALCNAVGELTDSQALLQQVDRCNLFLVSLDNHRTWFRYHDLFRRFLLQRFQQLSEAEQRGARTRAAQWLEQAGYVEDAMEQVLTLGDWSWARRLIEQLAVVDMDRGQQQTLQRWVKALPEDESQALAPEISSLITQASESTNDSETLTGEEPPPLVEPLTQREQEVMECVADGLTNKQIADKLSISPNTLKVHIRNLYGKMGVENRTQALLKVRTGKS